MVSPCLPLHMAVNAVHAPLHMPAFCLDQRSDSRGAPRYFRVPSLPRSPWCAVRHILSLSMPQSGKGACFMSRVLRTLAGALAPAHATIIWEGWNDDYVYAPLTVHVGDDLVLFWYWLQDHNVVVMPAREALTSF